MNIYSTQSDWNIVYSYIHIFICTCMWTVQPSFRLWVCIWWVTWGLHWPWPVVPGVQVHDCSVGQTCSSGQDQAGMLNGEQGLRDVKIGSLRFLVINFGGLVLDALFIYLIRCQSNTCTSSFTISDVHLNSKINSTTKYTKIGIHRIMLTTE